MGRHFRKNKKPRVNGEEKPDDRDSAGNSFVRENALFEAYYKTLGLMPEEEFSSFMEAAKTGLPSTFRITGTRQTALAVQKHLVESLVPGLPKETAEGAPLPVPRQIGWFPGGLAWNMQSDRKALRSVPEYTAFHEWLKAAMENGDISRQEAVSMIPPLLLDVKPEHLVLDMCAAPGSKTAQLVEALHAGSKTDVPTGLVIANDVDQKRAYLLHHQVKRILSPGLLVTNNDGTLFPKLFLAGQKESVQFDRILADVPCGGDGTIRKNPGIWRDWTVNVGLAMHPLQVRLLERAVALVRVGGRIVYSTCSMNPIEDEAVIAAVLSRHAGKVRLVDCSAELPGLSRLPGVSSWKVVGKDGVTCYPSHTEIPEDQRSRYPLTVFPQPGYADLGLERCMRVLPHMQDTGGFFIAVLEKVEETGKVGQMGEEEGVVTGFAPTANENPYRLVGGEEIEPILSSYGIDKELFASSGCAFTTKSPVMTETSPIRSLTLISQTAARLLSAPNTKLRVVNLGARAFEHYDVNSKRAFGCAYRVLTESAGMLVESGMLGGGRRLDVSPALMVSLLTNDDSVPIESCEFSEEAQETLKGISEGGVVLVAKTGDGHEVVVPAWRGERSLKAFVPKPNRPALLYQLQH